MRWDMASGTKLPLYYVVPFPPGTSRRGSADRARGAMVYVEQTGARRRRVPCIRDVISCDTTKFSNRFLGQSLGQFCATEPNLRKPNLRKRAETCKARYRCHPSPPSGRSERRSIGSARHLAAHRASRDVRTPPAQTSDPRAHMMFRDVQSTSADNHPPPQSAPLCPKKGSRTSAPTVSQTSRQPTAQKRPPPSR
jgi:hypothetical protein